MENRSYECFTNGRFFHGMEKCILLECKRVEVPPPRIRMREGQKGRCHEQLIRNDDTKAKAALKKVQIVRWLAFIPKGSNQQRNKKHHGVAGLRWKWIVKLLELYPLGPEGMGEGIQHSLPQYDTATSVGILIAYDVPIGTHAHEQSRNRIEIWRTCRDSSYGNSIFCQPIIYCLTAFGPAPSHCLCGYQTA